MGSYPEIKPKLILPYKNKTSVSMTCDNLTCIQLNSLLHLIKQVISKCFQYACYLPGGSISCALCTLLM